VARIEGPQGLRFSEDRKAILGETQIEESKIVLRAGANFLISATEAVGKFV